MTRNRWVLLLVLITLQGCITQIQSLDEYTRNGVGLPISSKREMMARPNSHASQIGWQEKTYSLANGNWVFVEPDRKDCFIHWEVDPQGIRVGYRLKGRGCEGQ